MVAKSKIFSHLNKALYMVGVAGVVMELSVGQSFNFVFGWGGVGVGVGVCVCHRGLKTISNNCYPKYNTHLFFR